MTTVAILGGTGYAGSHIAAEALSRGFHVVSWSRSRPSEPIEGVTYNHGDLLDEDVLRSVVDGADVVVGALSPRGALDGSLRFLYSQVADLAQKAGVRLGIVGGAGSLRVEEGGRTLASLPDFPEEFRSEAGQLAAVLEDLRSRRDDLQWFFVSPAGNFGSYNPGTHTGHSASVVMFCSLMRTGFPIFLEQTLPRLLSTRLKRPLTRDSVSPSPTKTAI